MANQFVNLPVPAGAGVGTPVDCSTFGALKTFVVGQGTAPSYIFTTIEMSLDSGHTVWTPLVTIQGTGTFTCSNAAAWVRATTQNARLGDTGMPDIELGGDDSGGTFFDLPATAGNGAGTSVDISAATGQLKTVQVGGTFGGSVLVEISQDGVVWAAVDVFAPNGGVNTALGVVMFARVTRQNVPVLLSGLPTVTIGVVTPPGGGGGGDHDCDCPGADPATSTQVGIDANAAGAETVAVGVNATSIENSVAVGHNANASGPGSVVVGDGATAEGKTAPTDAVVIGHGASVGDAALGGVAIGASAAVTGAGSIAIGDGAAAGTRACTIGSNASAPLDVIDVKGVTGSIMKAIKATVDIVGGAGGAVGWFISVDRSGVVAAEQVSCGDAGSGPSGVGRALFIAD